jgi:hypothetical protein
LPVLLGIIKTAGRDKSHRRYLADASARSVATVFSTRRALVSGFFASSIEATHRSSWL